MSLLLLLFQGQSGNVTPPISTTGGGSGGGHSQRPHYSENWEKHHKRHKRDDLFDRMDETLREQLSPLKAKISLPDLVVKLDSPGFDEEDDEVFLLLGGF